MLTLLHETQVSYDVLQMDETTVQVLKEDGRAAQTKSRMWVRRGSSTELPKAITLADVEALLPWNERPSTTRSVAA